MGKTSPEKYADVMNNRELSWLAFNRRVLQEAGDATVPLLQRLRFLGIFSGNQDEFFKVRMAKMIRLTETKSVKKKKPLSGGCCADELLTQINTQVGEAQGLFVSIYQSLMEELKAHGIRVVNEHNLTDAQQEFCREFFLSVISRQLVPLFLHKTMTMPFLADNRAYLAVVMRKDNSSKQRYAILPIPSNSQCPRFIELPSVKKSHDIIFQDDVIRLCLNDIFFMFGYDSISAYTFKIMRDSLMTLDDNIATSIVEKMEEELANRMHGRPIRLVYDRDMPPDLLHTIASHLKLREQELDPGARYHMMRDLMKFPSVKPELEYRNPEPMPHPDMPARSSIFKAIAKKDILVAFPYHTFNHVIDFLREAAIDPKVESICITLYRTAEQSKIINSLVRAAQNGKRVMVTVELLARFDEERNVETIDTLQAAGVHVIHGAKDLKVHSKLILIERRGGAGAISRFVYVGTGNFNESTACTYGDFGLFTADEAFGEDARSIFNFLGSMYKHFTCKALVPAPFALRARIAQSIRREIQNAKKGKPAYIWIKANNITDEEIIMLLYQASQAGVEIRLIVRSVCCLKPGVKGLSENIRAISIVDKYLEHARVMIFCNGGEDAVYISSADIMARNLDRRLEVAAPVRDARLKAVLKDYFAIQWADTVKARDLAEPGLNEYIRPESAPALRSQTALYDFFANLNQRHCHEKR